MDANGRSEVWLPLLRALTERVPEWTVWKNVDSALYRDGDVDAAAPRDSWPAVEDVFRSWAGSQGLGPVVLCTHIPGGFNLIALDEPHPFFELGVKDRRIYRGTTLFRANELAHLTVVDERGFRTVRPGAEGFFKLLLNGTSRGGGMNDDGLREKNVLGLLRSDPEGVEAAAELLGPARGPALEAARAAADGDWDRRSMMLVESYFATKAVLQPHVSISRIHFKVRGRKQCPVVRAILSDDRKISADPAEWIRQVGSNHRVYTRLDG